MIPRSGHILVAVSGGPDSVATLSVMARLAAELSFNVSAAHLNHSLRGSESDSDAAYVQQFCDSLGIPLISEKRDVPGRVSRLHESAELAARRVRRVFLTEAAAACGAERIATGHTSSDRAETVLANILRGTGPAGLTALRPVNLPFIRPLIEVTRGQVERYCKDNSLDYRRDSSNDDLAYTRNRMRKELMPYLASYFNPKIDEAILRLAGLALEDTDLLDRQADVALDEAASGYDAQGGRIELDCGRLNELHVAIRRRVLRLAIARERGSLEDLSFAAVDALCKAIEERADYSSVLPSYTGHSVRLSLSNGMVKIDRILSSASRLPWEYALAIPGRTEVCKAGIAVVTAVCASMDEVFAFSQGASADSEECSNV